MTMTMRFRAESNSLKVQTSNKMDKEHKKNYRTFTLLSVQLNTT